MAGFCLPPKDVEKFRQLRRGSIETGDAGPLHPFVLSKLESSERLDRFTHYFGKETAHELNVLYEEKLLLKDQRAGMRNWVNQLEGLNEETRKTLHDQINSHRKLLSPGREKDFLESLAAKKLGAEVTYAEAADIVRLSDAASKARDAMREAPFDLNKRMEYGFALYDLDVRVKQLKEPEFNLKTLETWKQLGYQSLTLPRAIMSSMDLSAVFNQGLGMVSNKHFWTGLAPMIRQFANEDFYRAQSAWIMSHPYYDLARKSGLRLTDLGHNLLTREEVFQGHYAETGAQWLADKINETLGKDIVPNPIRASNRAYTGFLNFVRFNRFVELVDAMRLMGEDTRLGSKGLETASKFVNDFTGTGAIGKGDKYANLTPVLSAVAYSARNLSATINMFYPPNYFKMTPVVRRAALKQLLGGMAFVGAILGLAKMNGYSVDLNPISQDFGSIVIGHDKWDFTGTRGTYLRLMSRMISGYYKTRDGKIHSYDEEGMFSKSRMDEILSFTRNKLAPTASIIADALYGSDSIGRPFDVSQEMSDKLVPMTMGSLIDYYNSEQDKGGLANLLAVSSILGINMSELYTRQRAGLTMWGSDIESPDFEKEDVLNDTLTQIGYFDKTGGAFPPKTINGVKLTDGQYHDYIKLSGMYAKETLLEDIQSEEFKAMPKQMQLSWVKAKIKLARTQAALAIIQDSLNSADNNIFEKSVQQKLNGTK